MQTPKRIPRQRSAQQASAAASSPAQHAAPAHVAPLRVLVVDDGARRATLILDELIKLGHLVVGVVDSALTLHDCVLRLQPDVVIVDAESPSRDTLENLAAVSSTSPRPVVVFSEDASRGPMQAALKAGVSAYVIAGLQPERLWPVLQVAMARFEQDRQLRDQLGHAQLQLSDRKVVDRAKGILMDDVGLSEEQAFRHLQKLAMDRGKRMAEVAQRVVEARTLLRPEA